MRPGGLNGIQAEKVRVPFASVNLVKLPDEFTDGQAVPISDICRPAIWARTLLTRILCLASTGGQQAPILTAAGADVTVFDASAMQLEQDEMVSH